MTEVISLRDTIGLIVSSLTAAGIIALIAFGRRIIGLPKEMIIVKAALFRLLRSNKTQGIALTTIAACQKDQRCDGNTDKAIEAVKADQERTDAFLTKAALGKVEDVEDELKP